MMLDQTPKDLEIDPSQIQSQGFFEGENAEWALRVKKHRNSYPSFWENWLKMFVINIIKILVFENDQKLSHFMRHDNDLTDLLYFWKSFLRHEH